MKVVSSETSSIAWFKLADFVARGEKERALTAHRLLMYSVNEKAFAYQLEGDILSCFDDKMALSRYHAAANVYKQEGKYKRAIAVYRHVLLKKEDRSIVEALLDLYDFLHDEKNIISTFSLFAKICLDKKNNEFLLHRLEQFNSHQNIFLYDYLNEIYVNMSSIYNIEQNKLKVLHQKSFDVVLESKTLI